MKNLPLFGDPSTGPWKTLNIGLINLTFDVKKNTSFWFNYLYSITPIE